MIQLVGGHKFGLLSLDNIQKMCIPHYPTILYWVNNLEISRFKKAYESVFTEVLFAREENRRQFICFIRKRMANGENTIVIPSCFQWKAETGELVLHGQHGSSLFHEDKNTFKWVYVDTGGSWPASYVGPWEEWGHRSWSEANGVKEKNKSMRCVFQTWAYIIQRYFWTLTVKNNMEKDEH